jgi:N,N-dimethylformamidase beta subunit-like, C-terminal
MLTGYTDALSVRPGGELTIFASSDSGELSAEIVRLRAGAPDGGTMPRYSESGGDPLGSAAGGVQATRPGSCMVAPLPPTSPWASTLVLRVWPTLPGHGRQGLADIDGICLVLDEDGAPALLGADGGANVTGAPLRAREWHLLIASRAEDGALLLHQRTISGLTRPRLTVCGRGDPAPGGVATFAAIPTADGARWYFDGKLADLTLVEGALNATDAEAVSDLDPAPPAGHGVVALWNLATGPSGSRVVDEGPYALHGVLRNAPTRAVTGPRWKHSIHDWRSDPDGYAAIHFHRDDLDDAAWSPTFAWRVPRLAPSGLYAVVLRAEREEDRIPFVVAPPRGTATARVAVLLPTLTYLAYANERLGREMIEPWPGWYPDLDPLDDLVQAHPEWGASLYDTHLDGSGVCHSSLLRPIPNLRPDYRCWFVDGGRHLAGDLGLLNWLERRGTSFDLLADHDLDRDGGEVLAPYAVVITGGHPEYVSSAMLDGLESFLGGGGRLMYLGGNGFYWVTDVGGGARQRIEVRRGNKGTRAWESAPGEQHQALSGEPGGLWRHRGRPPNRLTGVGFTAQGWDGNNRPYVASEAAGLHPWVFAGVDTSRPIGVSGHAMGAAAGDEIDRADVERGTPPETVVLASATGFSDAYQLIVEDVPEMHGSTGGSASPLVRADMTLTAYEGGGGVFSVGSIAWSTGLEGASGPTDAGTISANVLERFLEPGALTGESAAAAGVAPATEGSESG